MGLREGARAMGGRSRLQRVLNGESALAAWNRGQAPAYQVRTLGRVVPATRVTELDALIERAAPGVTYANVTGFPFAREAVERVTGESLEGYRVSISNHAMVHALKTHGSASERLRGQAPITREDLRIVPRIFRSSQVTDGGLTKQGRRAVRFSHQHGDFEFTASAELRTGRRELALITMWKRPR
ncbi:MAG: hypothetical protein IPI06_10200 [Gammaproteobacteria bacterium]|nr:hypothetical protein [Gammaproteobacteria bacterium]